MIVSKNYVFQKKIKCKIHSICSLFHFFNNQQPIKNIFIFSYKTYFKDNKKTMLKNYKLLYFLNKCYYYFLFIDI